MSKMQTLMLSLLQLLQRWQLWVVAQQLAALCPPVELANAGPGADRLVGRIRHTSAAAVVAAAALVALPVSLVPV